MHKNLFMPLAWTLPCLAFKKKNVDAGSHTDDCLPSMKVDRKSIEFIEKKKTKHWRLLFAFLDFSLQSYWWLFTVNTSWWEISWIAVIRMTVYSQSKLIRNESHEEHFSLQSYGWIQVDLKSVAFVFQSQLLSALMIAGIEKKTNYRLQS